MPNYAFNFDGHGMFTPEGKIDVPDVCAHNRVVESMELAHLRTLPDRVFLYVKRLQREDFCHITTFLGTVVDGAAIMRQRRYIGFGGAYRRAISCRIYGCKYTGWYMESSGDYCRLRKVKG